MALLQRPKGTQDHLPQGSPKLEAQFDERWHALVTRTAREVLERAGAQFIATPMFEYVEVVKRGVGGSTDIVRKEMFTVSYFEERDKYVLRPEGTAPIVRAYLENGLKQLPSPLRLWTHGAMFRAENVQKGRLRQFHQVDYEVFGSADPIVDAEAIALMVEVFEALGVRGVSVQLGSVGDAPDRERYNQYLRDLFTPHLERLSGDSRDRLQRNPMRILDSKDKGDRALLDELQPQPMLAFLGGDAAAHFEAVKGYLDAWGVQYDVDPSIVRGLDYYNRTAWEIHHARIGAKSALGGGGRYDTLAEVLGGPATPAVGWAFGVERALLALQQEGADLPERERLLLYVCALDAQQLAKAGQVAFKARKVGSSELAITPRNPRRAIQDANKRGARYVALVGEDEAKRGYVSVKDLDSGVQIPLPDFLLDEILVTRLLIASDNLMDVFRDYLRTNLSSFKRRALVLQTLGLAAASKHTQAFFGNMLSPDRFGPHGLENPKSLAGVALHLHVHVTSGEHATRKVNVVSAGNVFQLEGQE